MIHKEEVKKVRWGDYFSFLLKHPECRRLTEWDDAGLERTVRLWTEATGLAKGAEVLDIGCGFGYYAVELARQGFLVTGVEKVGDFLEEGRRRAAGYGVGVKWVEGEFPSVDLDQRFRAAVLVNGFDLWEDAKLITGAIIRLLEPGGFLVADAPGKPQLEEEAHYGNWSYREGEFVNWETGEGIALRNFPPEKERQAQLQGVKKAIEAEGFAVNVRERWLIARKPGSRRS